MVAQIPRLEHRGWSYLVSGVSKVVKKQPERIRYQSPTKPEWSVRQCRWQSFRKQSARKTPGQLTRAGSLRLRGKSTGKAAQSNVVMQMLVEAERLQYSGLQETTPHWGPAPL